MAITTTSLVVNITKTVNITDESLALVNANCLQRDDSLFGVPENNDDRISTQEHFTDESILVNWLCLFLSFPSLGHLDATHGLD